MRREDIAKEWADGPWKYSTEKRKEPFLQREVWGWVAFGLAALFSAVVMVHMWNVRIDAQLNGDPQEASE